MIEITETRLRQLCPSGKRLPELAAAMVELFPKFEITTHRRVAAFLAQAAHETAGFRTLREFGGTNYFRRYDGRTDLGNVHPGDGAKFCGRGIFQVTGRANYNIAGIEMGLPLLEQPELLEQPYNAVWSACLYWKRKDLTHLADKGDIWRMTRKINGGLNGLEEREEYYKAALGIFT